MVVFVELPGFYRCCIYFESLLVIVGPLCETAAVLGTVPCNGGDETL